MLKARLFPFALECLSKYFVGADGSSTVEIDQPAHYERETGGISVDKTPVWKKVPAAIFVVEGNRLIRGKNFGDFYEGDAEMFYDPRKWHGLGVDLDIQTAKISFRSNIFKVVSVEDYQETAGVNRAILKKLS